MGQEAIQPERGPRYVKQIYEQQFAVPAEFSRVRMWSFPLRASYDCIAELIARQLGICGEYGFRPVRTLSGDAILYMRVVDYPYMRMKVEPYHCWGYSLQRELLFAIPVRYGTKGLAFFSPLIFVDDHLSMLAGNTVLGFPKGRAEITLPRMTWHASPIEARAPVFPHRSGFSPEPMQMRPIVRVKAGCAAGDPRPSLGLAARRFWPFGDVESLFGGDDPLPLDAEDYRVFERYDRRDYSGMVQLKQFRDATDPRLACYQGIVLHGIQARRFYAGGLLPPVRIQLYKHLNLDIRRELGLIGGSELVSVRPFWIKLDFSLESARVVHAHAITLHQRGSRVPAERGLG